MKQVKFQNNKPKKSSTTDIWEEKRKSEKEVGEEPNPSFRTKVFSTRYHCLFSVCCNETSAVFSSAHIVVGTILFILKTAFNFGSSKAASILDTRELWFVFSLLLLLLLLLLFLLLLLLFLFPFSFSYHVRLFTSLSTSPGSVQAIFPLSIK